MIKPMYIRVLVLLVLLSVVLTGLSVTPTAAQNEENETVETTVETTEVTTEETTPETTEETTDGEDEEEQAPPIVTEDGHVIAQPGLLERHVFPEDWSRSALEFCVGNGILKGRKDGLAPKANTTRAETAALLVRLLGSKSERPDLKRYTDADPEAWYYAELAAAVELEIMNGTSATTLAPDVSITREQTFVLLSRAFGICPENTEGWKDFTDGHKISAYARNAVSALKEHGIINGYGDGTIRPKQPITRAEMAKLLYELITCICDDPADLPGTGRVLYRGCDPIPDHYHQQGDLFIGCGSSGEITLTGVRVARLLSLRPMPGSKITLTGCQAQTLSVPAAAELTADTRFSRVSSSGRDNVLSVTADALYASHNCVIKADVQTLHCNSEDITVTFDGTAEKALLLVDRITLKGKGRVQKVEIYGLDCQVSLDYGTLENFCRYDPERALEIVETLVVWDTVIQDTYLYSRSDLTGAIQALPAGTKLEHFYHSHGAVAAQVYTEDGTFGYVSMAHISIPKEAPVEEPYTDAVMEAFVNKMGYSSSTKYLVWVNLKTQTVNVFTGSKGSWNLVKSMPCSSGKNATPTIRGSFAVEYKLWEWDFVTYKVRYVTGFYGGYAFHSRIYKPDYSELTDPTIGTPASEGCLRMLDEDCRYIFDSIPYGTRVVVY